MVVVASKSKVARNASRHLGTASEGIIRVPARDRCSIVGDHFPNGAKVIKSVEVISRGRAADALLTLRKISFCNEIIYVTFFSSHLLLRARYRPAANNRPGSFHNLNSRTGTIVSELRMVSGIGTRGVNDGGYFVLRVPLVGACLKS